MKVLFVGDKPSSKNTDPSVAFVGTRSKLKLEYWAMKLNISPNGYYTINRIDFDFPIRVINAIYLGDPIIALGNNASKALDKIPHFKLPHPSPRNRQLNDPKFIEEKLKACKKWLDGV